MSKLLNPCYEHCYLRFGKSYGPDCNDKCEYAKAIQENNDLKEEFEELNRPIVTLEDLAFQVCLSTECENCPVCIHNFETRTKNEKSNHVHCVKNLKRWIIEQTKAEEKGR